MKIEKLLESGQNIVAGVVLGLIVLAAVVMLTGCVNYAKVEKTSAVEEKCRAVVRGYFFSFNNPAALEECRSDEDR